MSSGLDLSYLGDGSTQESTSRSREDTGARKRNLSRVVTFKSLRLDRAVKGKKMKTERCGTPVGAEQKRKKQTTKKDSGRQNRGPWLAVYFQKRTEIKYSC